MNLFSQPSSRRTFLGWAVASPFALSALERLAEGTGGMEDITALVESHRSEDGMPAVAAGVMKDGKLLALGASGVRKLGNPTPVTARDKFHIGSCTKAMTATLAAMLVEEGKFHWDQTLAEIFPERAAKMESRYRGVTLELLLSHRSGAPANGATYGDSSAPVTEQRLQYMDAVTRRAPEYDPATRYLYSNAGYIMAGAMMERVTGKPWEELMRTRLFAPLGMTSAGFGPPSLRGEVDQPWGHVWDGGKFAPRYGDNPAALGPAGTVHCSLQDYLRFADLHAAGDTRPPRLLKAETFAKLHEPAPGQEYALGWLVTERGWGKGRVLTHTGSNTMNFLVVWIAPKAGLSFVAAANAAGGKVPQYLDAVVGALVRKYAV